MSTSTYVSQTFCTSSCRLRCIKIFNCLLPKSRSRSLSAISAIAHFDGKCQNLQTASTHFCVSSYRFGDKQFFSCLPKKSRSRSRIAIFAVTPFDGKCQNLQTTLFYIFIFAKVWPVRKILTHTHTHRNRQAPGYMRILQICLKSMATICVEIRVSQPRFFRVNEIRDYVIGDGRRLPSSIYRDYR